jgi:hypothetical protein
MRHILNCLIVLFTLLNFAAVSHAADDVRVFELRIYDTHPGKLDALLARFRDHTVRLFEKHGMINVGYWVPISESDGAGSKLVYVLAHASRDAAKASWAAFRADSDWQAVQKTSEAAGPLLVHPPESIFLKATDYSPLVQPSGSAKEARVFELRTYTTPEGKLDALHARFRDHTRALFEKHGITSIAYWTPLDPDKGAGHTLTYLVAHPNHETAIKSWEAFRADPDWIKAKAASEKDGSLTVQGGVKSVFLKPTDFSTLK